MTLDPLSIALLAALLVAGSKLHRERHARHKAERARDNAAHLLQHQARQLREGRAWHDRDDAIRSLLDLIEMQGTDAPQDQRDAAWRALHAADDALAAVAAQDPERVREVVG